MEVKHASGDYCCEQCRESFSEKWKELKPNVYACPRCGQAKYICFDDNVDAEAQRLLELDDIIGKNVIPNLDDLNFKAAELFLRGLRDDYPDSPQVYFYSALADNSICYTQDDIDPEKYIPTLNDIRGSSIFKNKNVIKCLELAQGQEKEHYQEIFNYIETKRSEISKEFSNGKYHYDVFLSCKVTEIDPITKQPILDGRGMPTKTRESELAGEIYRVLWKRGIQNVFYSEEEKEKMAGKKFENVIFSALHQSKVLILVANKREYIDWRWVRNEWKRFLNVMNENADGIERKLILYTEELEVNEIPAELKKFQIVSRKNVGADDILFSAVKDAVKSGVVYSGTKVTASKIEAKKIETISIVKGQRFDSKVKLSTSEENEFELAQSDMRSDDARHYKYALEKLIQLSNSNRTNFKVNWAMVQCLFKVNTDERLSRMSLTPIAKDKNLPRLNEYLTNALGSANETQQGEVFKAMKSVFANTMNSGHYALFCSMLRGELPDLFATFIGFLRQEQMVELADELVASISDAVSDLKVPYSIDQLNLMCERMFLKVYSNADDALDQLLGLYQALADSYMDHKHYDYAIYCFNGIFAYDAYNSFALWWRFMASLKLDDPEFLPGKMKAENFVNYDINNDQAPQRRPENLYSTIVDILKGGYEINNGNGNYFTICVNTAKKMLLAKKEKIALPMYKMLLDLAVGQYKEGRVSKEYITNLLLDTGDLMCLTGHFMSAREYYGIVATNVDEENPSSYWGLCKAKLGIKSNYGAFLYKGRLGDDEFFKAAADHARESGDRLYLDFYTELERIKSNRKERGLAKKGFLYNEIRDIAHGECTSIKDILRVLKDGKLRDRFLHTEAPKKAPNKAAKPPKNPAKAAKAASSKKFGTPPSSIVAGIILLVLTIASAAVFYYFRDLSVLRFHLIQGIPAMNISIVLLIAIGLLIVLAILFRLPMFAKPIRIPRFFAIVSKLVLVGATAFVFVFYRNLSHGIQEAPSVGASLGWSEDEIGLYSNMFYLITVGTSVVNIIYTFVSMKRKGPASITSSIMGIAALFVTLNLFVASPASGYTETSTAFVAYFVQATVGSAIISLLLNALGRAGSKKQ
ncbi:MAG: hypothetical protein K6F32_02590 [Bacilli bacterium]|nr:hypothetical protein [Bacilli bacterium]